MMETQTPYGGGVMPPARGERWDLRYRVRCLCGWGGVRRPRECTYYECCCDNHVSWSCPRCGGRFFRLRLVDQEAYFARIAGVG